MKKSIPALLVLFIALSCNKNPDNKESASALKDEYVLKATIRSLPGKKIMITTLFGHNQTVIDSTDPDGAGNIVFKLSGKLPSGMYRIMLGKDTKAEFFGTQELYVDIIFNKENIQFSTDYYNTIDSMKIIKSDENMAFYKFIKTEHKSNLQLDILDQLVTFFPKSDDFYPKMKYQHNKLQNNILAVYRFVLAKYPSTLAARYIRSKILPVVSFELSSTEKNVYLKSHYFNNIDFADTMLLYTNLFASKSIDYIKLYHDPTLLKPDQNKEFIKAVDSIMLRAKKNDKVFNYIRGYLLSGFEKLENEEMLSYIVNKYPENNTCEDDKQTKNIKKRLEGSKKLAINSKAPEINIKDIKGKTVTLESVHSDYILIIFWASWCPHCQVTLPEIKKIYDSQKIKKFEVVAISIDTIKNEYLNFIEKGKYNWINCCDLKGWNSKAATDYFLYATPSMFLLNKNRNIVSKPVRIEELKAGLNLIK